MSNKMYYYYSVNNLRFAIAFTIQVSIVCLYIKLNERNKHLLCDWTCISLILIKSQTLSNTSNKNCLEMNFGYMEKYQKVQQQNT